jgi:hypothetical protein
MEPADTKQIFIGTTAQFIALMKLREQKESKSSHTKVPQRQLCLPLKAETGFLKMIYLFF